jgi:hypothetical protein
MATTRRSAGSRATVVMGASMNIRHVSWIALAWLAASTAALAGEADQLSLPGALPPETLAVTTARGDSQSAVIAVDVGEKDRELHSSASADAAISGTLIVGPVGTGDIGGLQSFQDQGSSFLQLSTGPGNIQQGVQAVALSF